MIRHVLPTTVRQAIRDWPIGRKLSVMALMPTLVAILVGGTAFAAGLLLARNALINDIRTQAQIIMIALHRALQREGRRERAKVVRVMNTDAILTRRARKSFSRFTHRPRNRRWLLR